MCTKEIGPKGELGDIGLKWKNYWGEHSPRELKGDKVDVGKT